MDWHLSVGILLLIVTVVRLKFSLSGKLLSPMRLPIAQRIKWILLLMVLIVGISGLTIFQKPPFGRSGVLFGSFPMPTLIRLDHSVHYVIIDLHIALSCVIAGLLIWHIKAGLQRLPSNGQSRLAIMLWPWRKCRPEPSAIVKSEDSLSVFCKPPVHKCNFTFLSGDNILRQF